MTIGYRLDSYHRKLLTQLGAPLSDKTMAHHYCLTTIGEVLNMPQLVANLTSHPLLSAILIHERDEANQEMKNNDTISMVDKDLQINASHLHSSVKGIAAFKEEGLSHVEGQPSLCYWPSGHVVGGPKVKELCDFVSEAKSEQKLQIQLPDDFPYFKTFMLNFKTMGTTNNSNNKAIS